MNQNIFLKTLTKHRPFAYAQVSGNAAHPNLQGIVKFYSTPFGLLIQAEIYGLPAEGDDCNGKFFGFHIHEKGECSGNSTDPFQNVGGHYNPQDCEHPHHAGDLPPLFSSNGYAWTAFLTRQLMPESIIGRAVIIHGDPDDFTTQPAGTSGQKIACGKIIKN